MKSEGRVQEMENIPHEVLQQGGFVGPRFTGVFFYRDVFWRVAIPIVFGTRAINALDALRIMPAETKRQLSAQVNEIREYLRLWADCYDYDSGYQRSKSLVSKGSFVDEMIESTERELNSAVADLCQQRPNSKARHSARDATEKALKALLGYHAGLTANEAKASFGHNLFKLTREVARQIPSSPLVEVQKRLDVFAPYEDRYTSNSYTRLELWNAYRLGQSVAAEVVRVITGVNQLSVILQSPVFSEGAKAAGSAPQ
jgi:HEPN domain-containing protein